MWGVLKVCWSALMDEDSVSDGENRDPRLGVLKLEMSVSSAETPRAPHLAALNLQRRGHCSRYSPSLMDSESCQLPWESIDPRHCPPQTHGLPRDLVKGSASFQRDMGWLGPSQQSSGMNCWNRESRTLVVCVRNWTFPETRWLWSISYDADVLKGFLIRDPSREAKAPFCLFQMPGTAAAIRAQTDPLGMVAWRPGRA